MLCRGHERKPRKRIIRSLLRYCSHFRYLYIESLYITGLVRIINDVALIGIADVSLWLT